MLTYLIPITSVQCHHNKGFTLLELMVVVAIMSIIAGAGIISVYGKGENSIQQNTQIDAARFEMKEIQKALLQYRRDSPAAPTMVSPVDFSFLLARTNTWKPDYKTGLRGPYMSGGDKGLVDIGDNLNLDGSGEVHIIDFSTKELQEGIPDPFARAPVANNTARPDMNNPCADDADNTLCLLDWRYVGQANSEPPIEEYGRPYLLFDFNGDNQTILNQARLVSMGPNGRYEGDSLSGQCTNKFTTSGLNDDLVLCLY